MKIKEPNLQETIERMENELASLVAAGRLPASCSGFEELDQYIDQNSLGGFCENQTLDAMVAHFGGINQEGGWPAGLINFIDDAQSAIDSWIKTGGLLQAQVRGLGSNQLRPGQQPAIDVVALEAEGLARQAGFETIEIADRQIARAHLGPIVAETAAYLVQSIGRSTAVLHNKGDFQTMPELNKLTEIRYEAGVAHYSNGRDRSIGIAR